MKTLFVDDTDIVDMQFFFDKLSTEPCQCRQHIFLSGIEYWQYIFTTDESALVTINKPIQQHNAAALYKQKDRKIYGTYQLTDFS